MKSVRLGMIGVGNMGFAHCQSLLAGKVPRVELAAVCDTDPKKLQRVADVPGFATHQEMFRSGKVDAVLVATPHYGHTTIGIDALRAGLHVLIEKPLSVHPEDAARLVAAHTNAKQVFALMFNQRTDRTYQKIRSLVQSGELGAIRRIHWTITNWFRTEAYYASGGWRATWEGEGGGVLLNQCPHNLDLFQWMFGMPDRLRAWCHLGKYHAIEVEDEVTAYMEYANGCTATFITSTGEAPGSNRLEVAAERGRLVYGDGKLAFTRNEVPMSEFSRTTEHAFAAPATWDVTIPTGGSGGQHNEILQNFADAILDGKPLLAPAAEGQHGVQLACAMLQSSALGKTVDLPIDGKAYARHLRKLIAASKTKAPKKKAVREVKVDLNASFR
jgi:predicted dehydrogenase